MKCHLGKQMSEIYKGESGYLKMLEDVVDGGGVSDG